MKRDIEHPSKFIPEEFTRTIRELAKEAERIRQLHPDQLTIIHNQGWFKMFVPRIYGGLELPLPEGVRIEECLSWTDGSTGWVVTLCSGAGWFCGFLPGDLLKAVLTQDKVCFAGSGAATGTATVVGDDYKVSGKWKYASGSIHATVFTANCVISKDGNVLRDDQGNPLVRAFLFRKDEVVLHPQWNAMGMVATGSHAFEVHNLNVRRDRCFIIDRRHAVLNQPLYQYPFQQLAEVTLTANLSGMAIRFMDLCEPLFIERIFRKPYSKTQESIVNQRLSEVRTDLNHRRTSFYENLDLSWSLCEKSETIPEPVLREVSRSSHELVKASRRCLVELWPYCGLSSANLDSEINRVWRNFHTASQHDLFMFSTL